MKFHVGLYPFKAVSFFLSPLSVYILMCLFVEIAFTETAMQQYR